MLTLSPQEGIEGVLGQMGSGWLSGGGCGTGGAPGGIRHQHARW